MNNEEFDREIFIAAIQRIINEKQLKYKEVAERTGKKKITVAQIASGQRFTTVDTLLDICDGLKVTPNDFLIGYLKGPANLDTEKYDKILRLMEQLKPNEVNLLYTIVENKVNGNRKR